MPQPYLLSEIRVLVVPSASVIDAVLSLAMQSAELSVHIDGQWIFTPARITFMSIGVSLLPIKIRSFVGTLSSAFFMVTLPAQLFTVSMPVLAG